MSIRRPTGTEHGGEHDDAYPPSRRGGIARPGVVRRGVRQQWQVVVSDDGCHDHEQLVLNEFDDVVHGHERGAVLNHDQLKTSIQDLTNVDIVKNGTSGIRTRSPR